MVDHIGSRSGEDDLRKVIGGDSFSGVSKRLYKSVSHWKSDARGELH